MSPSPLFLADEAAALRAGRKLQWWLIRQYVVCVLTANFWWAASQRLDDAAQVRGMFYDTAAMRALERLSDDDQRAARELYHFLYIHPDDKADRDTLCLAYVHLDFIIV